MTPRPHLLNAFNALTSMISNQETLERDPGVVTAITASVAEHYKTLLSLAVQDTFVEGVDTIPATSSGDRILVRLLGPTTRQYSQHEVTYYFGVDIFVNLFQQENASAYREALMRDVIMQTVVSVPIFGFTGSQTYGKFYGCAGLELGPLTSEMSAGDAKLEGVNFGQESVGSLNRSFKVSSSYKLENQSWQSWT